MTSTPKGMRLHIGIFGRRNVGKSSLLNAIARQDVSIVSEIAGTTTDPVEKPMELLPLGPVLFIDTAGIDDTGVLGALRARKTQSVFDHADLGILVAAAGQWGDFEEQLLSEFSQRKIPVVVVFNKCDLAKPDAELLQKLKTVAIAQTVASSGAGISELREAILKTAPAEFVENTAILRDLVGPGELAVLVVPIDKEAPKGRLILPQVQSIRDLLDGDSLCMVVKESDLSAALNRLKAPPKLVVTDSQAFLKVAADTPPEIWLTSFSILFSRFKGDLVEQVRGAIAVDRLVPGDRILVAEACTHHPIGEDIGRVKIPLWLTQYVGGPLEFKNVQGRDFPDDLSGFKLVIHCGACMSNRREVLSRIMKCRRAGVPITNYGLVIAYSLGIFERALSPFPEALTVARGSRRLVARPSRLRVKGASPPRVLQGFAPCIETMPEPAGETPAPRNNAFKLAPMRQKTPASGSLSRLMSAASIEGWLRETRAVELEKLYAEANKVRAENVGPAVHLRGLIEISNHCVRQCGYCGLRAGNNSLTRYRMSAAEILACVRDAVRMGYGTVVLQAGEDYALTGEFIASLTRQIKQETPLAVTLSLGERSDEDFAAWKQAGADRYLLRFETRDRELYDAIHPPLPGRVSDRIANLRKLRALGYEVGGGVMVGIPGQTYASLAEDILTFQRLDLDMIGIGPFIPHPATPLGKGEWMRAVAPEDQAPATEEMVYKTVALARLVCPSANLPVTTALATINARQGRELGLSRGANVVMPNLTPTQYRKLYEIYPNKACITETAEQCHACLIERLQNIGRVPGQGAGARL